jgi:hypothetical protein
LTNKQDRQSIWSILCELLKIEEAFWIEIFHSISALLQPGAKEVRNLNRKNSMLWTIFVILLVLWLLGLVSSYTLGGFIHLLLVIALVVLIIQLLQGRRPL